VPGGNMAGVTDEDKMLNEVLMASIQQNKDNLHSNSYEPLNPE
jgi:ubiquitin C-terminal hydrolase